MWLFLELLSSSDLSYAVEVIGRKQEEITEWKLHPSGLPIYIHTN
jgi:hypothetical protein